jgi:hypothetical protein
MRTTMDIDDTLMNLARELAIKTRRPLRAVVEEALREKFVYGTASPPFKAVKLPVSEKNGGMFPGIIWTIQPIFSTPWTLCMLLFDVNILIHAFRPDAEHHSGRVFCRAGHRT